MLHQKNLRFHLLISRLHLCRHLTSQGQDLIMIVVDLSILSIPLMTRWIHIQDTILDINHHQIKINDQFRNTLDWIGMKTMNLWTLQSVWVKDFRN